ncbi:hypothetical protein [Nocardia brasiliensis]|uniref:hypothetical protein n=1 Tax=Nocardia brasiliensis TaxID=37326 RepID=UPI002454784F|nr:hypothetical protein [Nocardia brasiliensis]
MEPTFWDDPAICLALAEWHMGHVIAAYRGHSSHSGSLRQSDVARWAGISQVRLSRIENGPPIKHLDQLIYWANLLHIPAELLWFQLPGSRAAKPASRRAVAPAGSSAAPDGRIGGRVTSGDPDIDALYAFRSADRERGGAHLYAEVITYLNTDVGPRMFTGDDSTGSTTFLAAAGLVEMAGWMAHDAGHDERSRRHLHRALDLSKLGGDPQFAVHVLSSLSHLELHRNQPIPALRHAYDAEMALSKVPGNPELAARVLAMQARGFAAQGRSREAYKLLDRAGQALDTTAAAPPSPWVSRFDYGALASEAARCARQLGDLRTAEQHARRIIELRPAQGTRSRAFGLLTLAAVLAEQGHPEQACAISSDVIAQTGTLASHLIVRHLQDLRQQLQPYRTSPSVTQFLECLGEAMRERTWIAAMLANQPEPTRPAPSVM